MLTVHVLNLPRRLDRRETFLKWNSQEQLQIKWIEAVDGQQLQFADMVREGIVLDKATHFTAGHIGCGLSHKLMWERAVRENQPLIICEDDAILRGDFVSEATRGMEQLPPQWDFLLFGYNFDSVLDVELIPHLELRSQFSKRVFTTSELSDFVANRQPSVCLPMNNGFGFHAYAVSPKGAKQLIELCFPMAGISVGVPALNSIITPAPSIDIIANAHYRRLHAYCMVPPLTISPHDQKQSDTLNSQPMSQG